MPRFWASLLHQDRGEPGAEVRVAQSNAELAFDQAVRDSLVIVVKAARHRRHPRLFEWHQRRRFDPEEPGGVSDDRLGSCRVVVADIVDGTRPRPLHRGDQHIRQIRDMDAREDLARLVDPLRGAGAQRLEGAAAGAVDRSEAEDVDRYAALMPEPEPTPFRGDPALAALAGWPERCGFLDPAAGAVAIDAGGREISEPGK